jgi:hypothetical protein
MEIETNGSLQYLDVLVNRKTRHEPFSIQKIHSYGLLHPYEIKPKCITKNGVLTTLINHAKTAFSRAMNKKHKKMQKNIDRLG